MPDVDANALKAFFNVIQQLNREHKLLAYHDRSDGGLLVTLCEMSFAGHTGITIDLDQYCQDSAAILPTLFNEELGAVIQIEASQHNNVMAALSGAGLKNNCYVIGKLNDHDEICFTKDKQLIIKEQRIDLQRTWSATSHQMQKLRDNPRCAQQEYDRILDKTDPGLQVELTFKANHDTAAAYIRTGIRPNIAVLREQGVNGQVEMAAVFDRAGFTAVDVHMSDLISGRLSLKDFKGFVACGGFSYGDVLGAGEGWAKSILFNPKLHDEFARFFQRSDTFALGVCNGCQMMSNLHTIIPGAKNWPHFGRNQSEQFEARFAMVEIQDSPSLFFAGMAGSRMPIAVSHGEGLAEFSSNSNLSAIKSLVTMRFVDNYGEPSETYPANPNGSPQGMTGFTTSDGRFNILMPHPERVFRIAQHSWYPSEANRITDDDDAPWMRMFRNARTWVG